MHLFHHIVVFSLNEKEKRAFLEAGVEFTRTTKTSRGETVVFEIGEDDPRYERVAALLKSLGAERFRDSSMTTPTLRDWVAKKVAAGGERLKQEAAVLAQWERGREVIRQSTELLKSGKQEEARQLLDPAIAEAIQGRHSRWASVLCRCAAAISQSMGDRQRRAIQSAWLYLSLTSSRTVASGQLGRISAAFQARRMRSFNCAWPAGAFVKKAP